MEENNGNPIYKFMKDNNLTQMDEASFVKEYSDRNKAKEIHKFMQENKLTELDEKTFYDSYLGAKKKGGWLNRLIRSIRAAYTAFKTEWRKV